MRDLRNHFVEEGAALGRPFAGNFFVFRGKHNYRNKADQVGEPGQRAFVNAELFSRAPLVAARNLKRRPDISFYCCREREPAAALLHDVLIGARGKAAAHAKIVYGINKVGFTDSIWPGYKVDARAECNFGFGMIAKLTQIKRINTHTAGGWKMMRCDLA